MAALRATMLRVLVTWVRAIRSRTVLVSLGAGAMLSLGCTDGALVTDPVGQAAHAFAIADGATGFRDGFYWLPPMVRQPTTSGTFDSALSPVVEICALAGEACDPGQDLVETFEARIGAAGDHYHVNWHVRDYDLSGSSHYRVSVYAGEGVLLGYADVEPVTNGGELRNVDTGEYIGLVDDRTLPIKFRIETGFAARLAIEPGEAAIEVGETQQFIGTVTDLHGDVLMATVVWTSEDEGVASVDPNGLATGSGAGTTTITGTVDGLTASTELTVESMDPAGEWMEISAGGAHTCGVSSESGASCWGWGARGQLGNGGTDDQVSAVAVAGDHRFATISAGGSHTCGVTTDGDALCWGQGVFGELGNGGSDTRLVPVAVAGNHQFASISAGGAHTCGVTTDGEALCWGEGARGRLGNGGTGDQLSPVAVAGNHQFASISAGGAHTCGVTTLGEALCWGVGSAVGDGGGLDQLSPAVVAGQHRFASISAGGGFTCGLDTDGNGLCWGFGAVGALGNGGTDHQLSPVAVAGDHQFALISAGGFHACGVTTAGEPLCWGQGLLGRLGNGGTDDQLSPVAVAGNHLFALMSAGSAHTCGMTPGRAVYCWGQGTTGQLGDGQAVDRFVPVRASDPF